MRFMLPRGRSPHFLRQFRRERTVPFFSGSFLLSLAVPPSLAAALAGQGSIRVLLERNPPKASPRPGVAAPPLGERAIPLLKQKKELYA